MKLVTLRTYDNSIQANLVKSWLESAEIECVLLDENIVSVMPIYNVLMNGIKLQVWEDDAELAEEVVSAYENSLFIREDGASIVCPKCGSGDLYSNFKSMKSAKGIIAGIFTVLFGNYPLYYDTVYRCKNCGTEFKEDVSD